MHDHEHEPRPVFEGDWQSATGAEKGAHSERVRLWKERTGQSTRVKGKGQSGVAQSQPSTREEEQAAHLSALQTVIDAPNSLASDRIRAIEARERILSKAYEEEKAEAHGPLLALGDALRALPEAERVQALHDLLVPTGPPPPGA